MEDRILAQQEAETLAFVNALRAEYKKPPLKRLKKGEVGDAYLCPIATSLAVCGEEVCIGGIDGAIDGRTIDLPIKVRHFIVCFDCGDYPHLVKASA